MILMPEPPTHEVGALEALLMTSSALNLPANVVSDNFGNSAIRLPWMSGSRCV